MATILEILEAENLIGMTRGITSGVPKIFGDEWFRSPRTARRDEVTWFEVTGSRRVAKQVHYASPARKFDMKVVKKKGATLIHSLNSMGNTVADLLDNIKDPATDQVDDLGKAEITRQIREFKAEQDSLRQAAIASALTLGFIYFDGNGNLLPTSSGAAWSVDFSVPANNKNQINGIIGTKWSDAAAPIIGDIADIKDIALKTTGYPLTRAYYGSAIPGYMAKNTEAKEFLARHTRAQEDFLNSAAVLSGLASLQWIDARSSFYEDSTGTNKSWVAADKIVFTPEPDPTWYEFVQGTFPIPGDLGAVGVDSASLLSSIRKVAGMGSFATVNVEGGVVKVEQFMFDTFLPLIKVPAAIYIADIEF